MKKWILTAVVLVIAGAVICFAAAASMGFDLSGHRCWECGDPAFGRRDMQSGLSGGGETTA